MMTIIIKIKKKKIIIIIYKNNKNKNNSDDDDYIDKEEPEDGVEGMNGENEGVRFEAEER